MYRARNVDNATMINGMLFGAKHGTTAKVKTEKAADRNKLAHAMRACAEYCIILLKT